MKYPGMYRNRDGEAAGLIYNIQKYTIHDGPGIRTALFFKGCPINCVWCSNPEGMNPEPEIGVYPSKCINSDKCSWCISACPRNDRHLIVFDENGRLEQVRQDGFCTSCLKCADVCPGRAIMVWGRYMTVPELMKIIEEDRGFYRHGGGVTLNGGEVMLQWEFASLLLETCHNAGINTCVESALPTADPDQLDAVLKHTDLLIADIKDMNGARHRKYTGIDNNIILKNIKYAIERGVRTVIRTPIIPGVNDDEQSMLAIGMFIREELGGDIAQYQLLPFRKMGTEKYATLQRPYPMESFKTPERTVWEENLTRLVALIKEKYGLPVVAGASHKIEGISENAGLSATRPRQNTHLPGVNSVFVAGASLDFDVFRDSLDI
jgi:pyruvate formate lyase activating enzyme